MAQLLLLDERLSALAAAFHWVGFQVVVEMFVGTCSSGLQTQPGAAPAAAGHHEWWHLAELILMIWGGVLAQQLTMAL